MSSEQPAGEPRTWPGWDDSGTGDGRASTTRRALLLAMAGAPWLVVAALLLRPVAPTSTRGAPGSPLSPQVPASAPADAGQPAPSGGRASRPAASAAADPQDAADRRNAPGQQGAGGQQGTAGPATYLASGARTAATPAEAAALAVVGARAWLSSVGPPLGDAPNPAADGPGRYVEHLAVEAVDFPAPGHAVVTVVAVVLDVDGEAYTAARAVRVAVPLALDASGARLAGAPWWLTPPGLAPAPPAWTPVDDPELLTEAGAAVTAAGYLDVTVQALHRTDGWPLLVEVVATAPGAPAAARHELWLRQHLGRLVVAGERPAGADQSES